MKKKEYKLEYGTAVIEVQDDSITKGQKVLIHDDLLATGGTAQAAASLIQEIGGTVVGFLFLIELEELEGKKKLAWVIVVSRLIMILTCHLSRPLHAGILR